MVKQIRPKNLLFFYYLLLLFDLMFLIVFEKIISFVFSKSQYFIINVEYEITLKTVITLILIFINMLVIIIIIIKCSNFFFIAYMCVNYNFFFKFINLIIQFFNNLCLENSIKCAIFFNQYFFKEELQVYAILFILFLNTIVLLSIFFIKNLTEYAFFFNFFFLIFNIQFFVLIILFYIDSII